MFRKRRIASRLTDSRKRTDRCFFSRVATIRLTFVFEVHLLIVAVDLPHEIREEIVVHAVVSVRGDRWAGDAHALCRRFVVVLAFDTLEFRIDLQNTLNDFVFGGLLKYRL